MEDLNTNAEPKHAGGRPTDYSVELAAKICSQLAEGISLRTVCKAEGMPDKSTVFVWLGKHPEFKDQYARAKEESADALYEEIVDIADDGRNDWMEIWDEETNTHKTVLNHEHVQRSKLRVDTRKWMASKMKPKKFGDKLDVLSGGEPIKSNTIIVKDFNAADSQ